MFGSLLSFASLATWVQYPLTSLALTFDGIIFSLVSYSYNLFLLMAQLNMNSILGIAGALIDRLRALIMVFVVFRLAMSLINYLIDPGKATDSRIGGVALVKRIVITAAMLLSYNFVFALLNDINLIVVGFNDVSDLQVIEGDSADRGGLIARLVFGANSDGGIDDFGKEIAVFTFQQFLRNDGSPNYEPVFDKIKDPNPNTRKDFTSVAQLADEVGKTVVYEYPFVSAAVGLFMVYSIVKMAIEIGVRMFKLLVLQMLAPVAIISYIDPASEQKIWKNYTKAYLTTYTDAFIRIAAIFLSTAFISAITASLSTMFGSVSTSGATGGIQKMLITVMVIIAGYRFALLLPKFVSGLFGVDLSENSKGSFGKFMAGLGGLAIGGVTGLTTGIASGAGLAGTAANMFAGAFNGASSGMKGQSISDAIKNIGANNEKNRNRALNIARMGGFGAYAVSGIEKTLGIQSKQAQQIQRQNDNKKALENMVAARSEALSNNKFNYKGNEIKYGSSADDFASKMMEYDDTVINAQMAYEKDKNPETLKAYRDAKEVSSKHWKSVYEAALFANDSVNNDAKVIETTKLYDSRAEIGYKSQDLASGSKNAMKATPRFAKQNNNSNSSGNTSGPSNGNNKPSPTISAAKKHYSEQAANIGNKGATRRTNRPNTYGGGN